MNPESSSGLYMNPREEEIIEIPSVLSGSVNPNPAATTGERSANIDCGRLLNPNGEFSQVWSAVLILICGLAVSADPLFLYIPIVNKDIKCTRLDRHLGFMAVLLRFPTDLFCIYDIIWKVHADCISWRSWRSIKQLPFGFLAFAPITQVIVFLSFPRIIRFPSSSRMILNSLLVLQYAIRVRRIYQLLKKLEKHITQDTPIKRFEGVGKFWISGAFIIFEFILASHVFGALWYFFSFQRLMDCWKYACRNENGCELGNEEMRKKRNPQIASWLDENGLPLDLKEKIMTCALNELKADEDVDIKNIHFILPLNDLINIKRRLCLDTLKKVTRLQNLKEKEFEAFCEYLKPVIHEADTFIIREGEQFEKLLFITQGKVRTYTTTSDDGRGALAMLLVTGAFRKVIFMEKNLFKHGNYMEGRPLALPKMLTAAQKSKGLRLRSRT